MSFATKSRRYVIASNGHGMATVIGANPNAIVHARRIWPSPPIQASRFGALIAISINRAMPDQRKDFTDDEIRRLIEGLDGQLREAERLRSYANERTRRGDFFPERRTRPRIPLEDASDNSSGDSA
jgi:hypothetical protein